ncbi:DUF3483 domain-containing protein [Salinisphaera hydrothermalis]|uniref:DUF3483 domain-containing protein n=1 Tax=Salinisphaera hydrothermalis TaxID=563188 RepID=UPI0033425F64
MAALPGWMLLVSLLGLVAGVAWRASRWSAGRSAPIRWSGLAQVPRRYLVDVHHVVSRSPLTTDRRDDTGDRVARMHVLTAGGFVAATLFVLLRHLFGIGGWVTAWLILASLAAMAVGTAIEWRRRRPSRPARLSSGGFDRLPWSLAAFVVFFGVTSLPAAGIAPPIAWASPLAWPLIAIGVWACAELYVGMALGPMKHAVNGVLHLAFHPRPARFEPGARDTALAPADLEADKIGVETAADFDWNRLLGFDACVQCGRCEAACPAFEAGLPLNPKALIQDLVVAEVGPGATGAYRGSGHPDRDNRPHDRGQALIDGEAGIHPDTLWACTTCRACVAECPMMIEHVDAVIDMRRFQTLEAGATPSKGAATLDALREADNMSGKPAAARADWAVDLKIPLLAERGRCDVLLWMGEGAFERRNQRTLRSLVQLLRKAGVDFAILGAEEADCGDLARRLGDDATFQRLARANIATLDRYEFNEIVTADPHVLQAIGREYPALGGHYKVRHHTTYLSRLVVEGRLPAAAGEAMALTYHDPCYLGRYNGETEAPRRLLEHIGQSVTEMHKSGERSSCCGSGGGLAVTDIPGRRRIADVRMEHVAATGAETVAVACPHCATMLEGVVAPRADVVDIAELLADAVAAAEPSEEAWRESA